MARVIWHGVVVDDRTAKMLDEAQRILGFYLTATQGSYSTSVAASGLTHAGGGAVDLAYSGDGTVLVLRQVGFAAWHRTPAQGFSPHIHCIAVGCPDLSAAAAQQVQAYFQGRDGLADNAPDDGPRTYVGQTWEGYLAGTPAPGGGVVGALTATSVPLSHLGVKQDRVEGYFSTHL